MSYQDQDHLQGLRVPCGAVVVRSVHILESLRSIPRRSKKSVGDFSNTLNTCPPSSQWVPGVIRELRPVTKENYPIHL